MKKDYKAPVVEKVTFDYKVQTASSCTVMVMNLKTADSVCGEGTPGEIALGPTTSQP